MARTARRCVRTCRRTCRTAPAEEHPSEAWSPYPSEAWSPRVAELPEPDTPELPRLSRLPDSSTRHAADHLLRPAAARRRTRLPTVLPIRRLRRPSVARQMGRAVALPAQPRPLWPRRTAHARRRLGPLALSERPDRLGAASSRQRHLRPAAVRAGPGRHQQRSPMHRPLCPARPPTARPTSRPTRSTTTCRTTPAPSMDVYGGKYLNPTQRPLIEWGMPLYLGGPVPPPSIDCGPTNPSLPRFYLYGDYRAAAAYNAQNGADQGVLANRLNLEWDLWLTVHRAVPHVHRPAPARQRFPARRVRRRRRRVLRRARLLRHRHRHARSSKATWAT